MSDSRREEYFEDNVTLSSEEYEDQEEERSDEEMIVENVDEWTDSINERLYNCEENCSMVVNALKRIDNQLNQNINLRSFRGDNSFKRSKRRSFKEKRKTAGKKRRRSKALDSQLPKKKKPRIPSDDVRCEAHIEKHNRRCFKKRYDKQNYCFMHQFSMKKETEDEKSNGKSNQHQSNEEVLIEEK